MENHVIIDVKHSGFVCENILIYTKDNVQKFKLNQRKGKEKSLRQKIWLFHGLEPFFDLGTVHNYHHGLESFFVHN